MFKFRPNVALILQKQDGRILICERSDIADAWQFPQGGARKSESLEEAIEREVREEISLGPEDYSIVDKRGPYRYSYEGERQKEGYDGQEQTYFLANFLGNDGQILASPETHEFQAAKWIHPSEFRLEWVAPMKRKVYRDVFTDFFGEELGEVEASSAI